MKTSRFDFFLPPELIAQSPLPDREASRLLVVDRKAGTLTEHCFSAVADFFSRGEALVINNSRVIPARLWGQKKTGARIELLLLKKSEGCVWEALLRPAKRVRPGDVIALPQGGAAELIARMDEKRWQLRLALPLAVDDFLESYGQTPLPPYIIRQEDDVRTPQDRERYQTVYAKEAGSIAAPTAGLHFTADILSRIAAKGVAVTPITLHVGYGTFAPLNTVNIEEHRLETEAFTVSVAAAAAINGARRVIAVGSTACRVLETVADAQGNVSPQTGNTGLFITPGYTFKSVDCLLTNFHLPCSTLFVLVCAFAGEEFIRRAYEYAIAERFRFYSYGDCMLII